MTQRAGLVESVIAERYVVQREIARGSLATLYLALDRRHDRHVALKVLRPELTGSVAADRFLDEIKTVSRLSHPHILPLHDSGEHEGLLFFVMPFVAGPTLRGHIEQHHGLELDEVLRLAREIADALAYAHDQGIVHRDIKPENILLEAGHAVVADFGIALALERATGGRLTETGVAVGTPSYMSPEQSFGSGDVIDGRSDIYSLGCVLFEMLVGSPPFRGPSAQALLAQHRTAPPPRVRDIRRDVPPQVDQAISRALAKNPEHRFDSARAFVRALPVTGETHVSGEDSRAEHSRRRRMTRVALWATAACGVAALAAVPIARWVRSGAVSDKSLDRQLVTIAPFRVASSDNTLAHWNDDLPAILAGALDGAGPLRASLATSFQKRPSIIARDSAESLGRRTGAGFVIFGTIVEPAPQAVRVSVNLLDVARGLVLDEVVIAWKDSAATPDQLVSRMGDSLSRALLASLGAVTRVAAVRRAGAGCPTSSDATKRRYLRAEQFFRQNMLDSARTAYEDVIAADPSCALAYRRVAHVEAWENSAGDSLAVDYQLRAGRNNHGLSPRDSLLVTADSLDAALRVASTDPAIPAALFWSNARRLFGTYAEAVRRYPADAEVWYGLADIQYHWGWGLTTVPQSDLLVGFDRAIAIDSGFVLPYLHAIEIAFALGDSSRALRYADLYLAKHPVGVNADYVKLALRLLSGATALAPETNHLLATTTLEALVGTRLIVDRWPDARESAVRVSWQIATREDQDSVRVARCQPAPRTSDDKVFLAKRLAYRGHLAAAACALGKSGIAGGTLVTQLAHFGAITPEAANRVFDEWIKHDSSSITYAYPWWSERGDTARLAAEARRADSLGHAPTPVARRDRAIYRARSARAYLALAGHDTAGAITALSALPDSLCEDCFTLDRLTRARLLAGRNALRDARRILDEWRADDPDAFEILYDLENARISERAGDSQRARQLYRRVAAAWANADPVLRPFVSEASRRGSMPD